MKTHGCVHVLPFTHSSRHLKCRQSVLGVVFLCGWWWALASPVWGELDGTQRVQAIKEDIRGLQVAAAANPRDPQTLTELSGLYLKLGDATDEPRDLRISWYEQGARLAKEALSYREDLADAHFYYAANLGSATQMKGVVASALVVRELKAHAERAVELQADHGPALHMLGKMSEELPWFLGGDQESALAYLQKAVLADQYYSHARLDLAKLYLKRGQSSEAIEELRKIIRLPRSQQSWTWKHEHKPEAERLLRKLGYAERSAGERQ